MIIPQENFREEEQKTQQRTQNEDGRKKDAWTISTQLRRKVLDN